MNCNLPYSEIFPSRALRKTVWIAARILRPNGKSLQVQVLNLSYDGCRLWTDETLLIGEAMLLKIADLPPLKSQVRWALQRHAGLKFT